MDINPHLIKKGVMGAAILAIGGASALFGTLRQASRWAWGIGG